MPGLDPRSFIVISTCLSALCGFLCFVLRNSIPREIRGLTCWGNACIAMVVSSLLFASRQSIDILFSSFGANVAIVIGIVLMYCSVRQFCNRRGLISLYVGIPLAVAILLIWPTFFVDSYRLRVIIISAVNTGLFIACAQVLGFSNQKRLPEYFTLTVFAATGLVSAARCLFAILSSTTTDPLTDSTPIQYLYLATFAFSLVALSLGFILMVGKRLQIKLEEAAFRDGLTGIATRSAFEELAEKEIAKSWRSRRESSVLMIDLDNFKSINDKHGHRGGDRVLKDFVRRTNEVLRGHDLFGRYGGEEFVVLLPNTSEVIAMKIARRILDAAQEKSGNEIPPFTVSIGLAIGTPKINGMSDFLNQADEALYRAKAAGKNRVDVFSTTKSLIASLELAL
jgi:diguanylate cyclase (GGDEF)-like protein